MGRTKPITFQYFQIQLQKESVSRNGQIEWRPIQVFDFPTWLARQNSEGMLKKNYNVNNDFIGNLESIAQHEGFYYARFYKLRDIVPAKVKDGAGAESIELEDDEYIGEDVCLLYDDSNGVCMLQKNRFSVSYLKLSEWLSMSCEKGYRVRLRPINDTNIFDKLLNKNIRSFDVSFANLQYDDENYALSELIQTVQKFNGSKANIRISVGRERHRRLDKEAVNALLSVLKMNKGKFSKAKVTLSDENDTKVEVLDLFDAIMSSTINFTIKDKEILDFNTAINRMTDAYQNKLGELSQITIMPRG